jgi:protein gp37
VHRQEEKATLAIGSHIEWTEATWNPVTGCSKVSPGCAHCYAERMARRLQGMGMPKYAQGFNVAVHEAALGLPLNWRRPREVFVNSMGDLFHEQVPLDFVLRVFAVMHRASQHRYQLLTKRAERLAELDSVLPWAPNIWMGVTVESDAYVNRVDSLRHTGAAVKFLSMEPLLGPVPHLDITGIDWVIVGGESGPRARPMQPSWAAAIRDSCLEARVPFYFKQWGGWNKKRTGRELEGRIWDQRPEAAFEHPAWSDREVGAA